MILGGSTWPGEDEVLLKIYKRVLATASALQQETASARQQETASARQQETASALQQEAASARQPETASAWQQEGGEPILVIAPRHFEKADAIEANIRKAGFECVRRSRGEGCAAAGRKAVYLVDTTGELMGLYGIADIVFVGKSLCAHGSQNMIEPCLCGKPTLVGPYTENFRPVMSDLLASEAIVQVKDADELEARVVELFAAGDRGLGVRAKAAVEKRLGVVAKCVDEIRGAL